ncbi:hypothetical protein D3C76_1193350 [compost metagenome]
MQVEVRPFAQDPGQRRHLDRLWAGPEYHHDCISHRRVPREIPRTKLYDLSPHAMDRYKQSGAGLSNAHPCLNGQLNM